MSLDNIQLPPDIIQSLYSKCLYDLETGETVSDNKQKTTISFLGNNQKKIAILVKSADAIYLAEEDLNFLLGILTACKLSMADVALLNIFKNPELSYIDLTEQLKAEKIILFGIDIESLQLPLQFPNYQVQKYNDQVYLSAASLIDMQKDKAEKMKLWNCLKNIFSL